ncbi:aldehyde oxidase 3-like isoform X3 [Elephas maximus indicus]|uniref:aldehyde oxidase 3-like isoform X3 n=1 Tax=Elephas maximus indicus TaxID=99487 RepID=UPI0021168BD7|nr:aldehyde oxidase 3-like isoform X3 [Elephas maximus indicus]
MEASGLGMQLCMSMDGLGRSLSPWLQLPPENFNALLGTKSAVGRAASPNKSCQVRQRRHRDPKKVFQKKVIERNPDPEVNLLFYLRKNLRLTGTKYGCGGGDCGACTVMISRYDSISKKICHFSVTACLVPICSLYGVAVTTVEGVGSIKTRIHPVQERIAKGHGTQCGFCTPGMVMSIYTLLRNHSEPSTEQLMETLGGNLCRCTGYRPIVESGKSFSPSSSCCQMNKEGKCCLDQEENEPEKKANVCTKLYEKEEFQPFDPTQEFIFPPELMRIAEEPQKKVLTFHGERTTWITPGTLNDLLRLKMKYPEAPLVMGNTSVGPAMKFKEVFHPVILSPARILKLFIVTNTKEGLTVGAGLSLAQVKDILADVIRKLPEEKTQLYRALLKHLKTLAGQQIRNMASLGGHIISRLSNSDLNPILGVGNCILNVASIEGTQQIPLNDHFLAGTTDANLKPEQVLVSVFIPVSKKWEFVSAFRQAPRQQNALATVNAGMSVIFKDGTNTVVDLNILYGGVGPTTVSASKSCQQLIGRCWDEGMLSDACRLVLDEITLPVSAPGGMVEFRRTLMISFLFKFYLDVLQQLKMRDPSGYPDISKKFLSVLEDFPLTIPHGIQSYKCIDPQQPPQDPVGRPIMHQSGIKHATGEAVFCDDMPAFPEELFLAVVTSTRPHAKLISIDASEALALPGVVDVITARDVPGDNGSEEERLYAQDEVICVGQIICTVAADSYAHAKQAARKVKIAYQDMEPVIVSIQDAIKHQSFIGPEKKLEQGNIEEAFQSVDQIIEGEVHFGGQEHFYMETQSVLVVPKAEDKEMDIYVSSQDAALTQEMVAYALDIPKNRINCHVKRVGGAFGGKAGKPALLAAVAAVAANKTGHPIRFILERGDDMLITGGRHPLHGKYKVGFMNNGKIEAADIECHINGGCTPDDSELVIEYALLKLENAYKIPNLRVRGRACKTNLPSNTAFRGFGFPQGAFVTEAWMTAVAAKCHLPPEKVRELNMYKTIDRTIHKQEFDPKNLIRCWEKCMENSSYYLRKKAAEEFNQQNYWKKRGIAIIPMKFSVGYPKTFFYQAAALVHIYTDGSVLVAHGGVELGQGINTKMLQVASRELKIPMSYIHLGEMNTVTVPNTIATAASTGADVNGKAVQNACQTLRRRLEPIISKSPHGSWKDWVNEAFTQSISLSATGYFRGYEANIDWEKGEGDIFPYFVFGAACSEVEIDCLTGAHKNIRTDIVMDASFSINPAVDIGQVEGAFTQGLGLYTLEELKYSPDGVLYTRGPRQYKIPSITDIPEKLHVSLLTPTQNPIAIYSSKGLGESGMFLGSSVFFAITDAVAAARKERGLAPTLIMNSPATPEQIRMACVDQFTDLCCCGQSL